MRSSECPEKRKNTCLGQIVVVHLSVGGSWMELVAAVVVVLVVGEGSEPASRLA